MEILLWIVSGYFVLGAITAAFLTQTPYSGNGFLKNTVCAGFYWIAALRGDL